MTEEIKQRIGQLRKGVVPSGYVKTKAGIMPADWNINKKAKDVFKSHTDKKHNGDLEILAATQEDGIVPRSQIGIDIKCSDEGISGYKKVDAGDFIISLRSFQGGIEYSPYNGILSPAYTVLKSSVKISDEYYKNYFKTAAFISRLNSAVYGIRDGKQIGYADFGDLIIHNPPLAEQQKIAEILQHCDKVIALKMQKIEELKQLKKESLTKMFPQKGEAVPEIRFPGFTGTWEQRKLGDEMNVTSVKRILQSDWTNEGIRFLRARDIVSASKNEEPADYLYISKERYEEYSALSGKVVIGDMLVTGVGTIGIPYLISNSEPVYFKDGNIIWFQNEDKIDGDFFYYSFCGKAIRQFIKDSAGIGTVGTYTIESGKKTPIFIPTKSEQKAIGQYFSNLDDLITLHQRELSETLALKKALMQLLLTGIVRVNA